MLVVGWKARQLEEVRERPHFAPMHRVPERADVDDRVGQPARELPARPAARRQEYSITALSPSIDRARVAMSSWSRMHAATSARRASPPRLAR